MAPDGLRRAAPALWEPWEGTPPQGASQLIGAVPLLAPAGSTAFDTVLEHAQGGAALRAFDGTTFGLFARVDPNAPAALDAWPYGGDPASAGAVMVDYATSQLVLVGLEAGYGYEGFAFTGRVPSQVPDLISAWGSAEGAPVIAVGDGQPGRIGLWRGTGFVADIADAGDLPRRIRCALPLCLVTNEGSDDVTLVSWDGTAADPVVLGSEPVVAGPIGLDIREDAGEIQAVVAGFGADALSVLRLLPDGTVLDNQTVALPAECTDPGHAIWYGSSAIVSCNGTGTIYLVAEAG